ncbi:DNA alkylation repair protein [Cryobacterium sp. TMS1-13-1]|uniref:DNA alkylation repair protein n=1 Tax=Cryobacterium sp. TMS1-13-1 TaxID=1259220 RepID=UPI00106ADA6E|nr:DNA alkylation repair protein [Cryobacterium sp. TMS1-13-1]TFD22988.1 DNA alkylation repair protein [Cryobacterium sp. TMS1-13-1]
MSDAGDFVDRTLQYEATWERAAEAQARLGSELEFYGASVGAVRGTIRDLARRYRNMTHDDVTALSSELWKVPVFERRLAAIVLLQANVTRLDNTDLTRIEGFLRGAVLRELVDPLTNDVVLPLVQGLSGTSRLRADAALARWAYDGDPWLRRAADGVSARITR